MSPAESAELERALHDPDRFHSDGREVLWACIVIPVLCVPLMAVLFPDAHSAIVQIRAGELSIGSSLLFAAPELLGLCGLLLLALGVAAYGLRTYGRHGVAITSFGVSRIRGRVRTLIRYPDIEKVTFGKRRRPEYRIVTDEVEVKAKDGRTIRLYGFGVLKQKEWIEREMQQAARPAGGQPDSRPGNMP